MAQIDDPSMIDMEIHDTLLNHVLLPRVLPQEKSRYHNERELVLQFIENVDNLSEWLPEKTVDMMDRLKRVTREYTRTVVTEIINELKPGDSFSMFVRRQNCAIMFHIPATEKDNLALMNVIVGTFMGTLHPREIFNHENEIEVWQESLF